ncbi:MAG: sigma-E factor negative regulatory protein [Gammaproteobacteria bacterium]|nr:sigma-E factor negative regulatory protein [Gammaproteobacteria bacterium]
MSEKLRESLSATVDDEADEFELRRVLDEMEKDSDLRETWARYHLIGSHMRGLVTSRAEGTARGVNLREQVWAALDLEDSQSVSQATEVEPAAQSDDSVRGPWLGRITGLAVAASVAFAIVFGFGGIDQDDEAAPTVAANTMKIKASEIGRVELQQEVSASDLRRANAYYLHHVQHQALNQPSVASFVKLVTYEHQ